jgi:hypothetical protein
MHPAPSFGAEQDAKMCGSAAEEEITLGPTKLYEVCQKKDYWMGYLHYYL